MKRTTVAAAALLTAAVVTGFMASDAAAATVQRLQVSNVVASSTLPDEPGYSYDVWNIVDHDPTTCWTEGVSGDGVGEYIDIYIPQNTVVTGALVYPGYYRDKTIFDKNGAPTMLTFSSGGVSVDQYMTDYATNFRDGFEGCYFNLSSSLVSDGKIRVKIGKVRTGNKYADTCISELYLYGYSDGAAVEVSPDESTDVYINGDGKGVIPDDQLWDFSSFGKLLLDPYWDGSGEVSVFADDVTSSQRAMALYWYQYTCSDQRIAKGNEFNKVSFENGAGIITDLFGDHVSLDEDLRTFRNYYAESFNGRTFTVAATGDFGDAGDWFLSAPTYEGTREDEMILSGVVLKYSSASGQYEPAQEYIMFFKKDGTNRSGNGKLYEFREIHIL